MKRRFDDLSLIPAAKKQKQEKIDYLSILNPLLDNNKLQINGKNYKNDEDLEKLEPFIDYDNDKIKSVQRQLAQFITNQLSSLGKGIPNDKAFDSFNKLNIRTSPQNDEKLAYNPNTHSIGLNTYEDQYENINPLVTLLHEGTHALDDLYMRNSQDAAVNTLAKMERAKEGRAERNLLSGDRSWYNQAQNIINIESFKERYPLFIDPPNINEVYPKGYGHTILEENQFNLIKKRKQPVGNFRDIKKLLGNRANNYREGFFEEPFTEFTAHVVENIHEPWLIHDEQDIPNWNQNYWQNNNDGRKFLKGITKGVYRNFQELDPQFSTNYPNANQAFLDRIGQLRNYDKYKTSKGYLTTRNYTLQPGYNPISTTPMVHSLQPNTNNLNQPNDNAINDPFKASENIDYNNTHSPKSFSPFSPTLSPNSLQEFFDS